MTIKLEDVEKLLSDKYYEILRGTTGCTNPGSEFIKAVQDAGYNIVKIQRPLTAQSAYEAALEVCRETRRWLGKDAPPETGPVEFEEPRWAEADDVPWPGGPVNGDTMASDYVEDVTRGGILGGESPDMLAHFGSEVKTPISYPINAEDVPMYEEQIANANLMNEAVWGNWGNPEPPVEEPILACTQPNKKKFTTKMAAEGGAKGLKERFGAGYQPLYPYECTSGGHWHLSHYRQGEAVCPVCQIKRPAWRGGESYWVISRHNSVGNAGACNGTGDRVYDKGQTL